MLFTLENQFNIFARKVFEILGLELRAYSEIILKTLRNFVWKSFGKNLEKKNIFFLPKKILCIFLVFEKSILLFKLAEILDHEVLCTIISQK